VAHDDTPSLFQLPDDSPEPVTLVAPLADRMRPRTLEEFVGQAAVVGEGSILGKALKQGGKLPSFVLLGRPGSGKTTLGRLIAERNGARSAAARNAEATAREPVPFHLRNAVTALMKAAGYRKGYR
jgi:replication-associated recombination protein RarA